MNFIKITTFMHCVRNGSKALAEIWNVFTVSYADIWDWQNPFLWNSLSHPLSVVSLSLHISIFIVYSIICISYSVASWTRTCICPISALLALKPQRQAASNHAEKFAATKKSQIWNSNRLESLCMFTISRSKCIHSWAQRSTPHTRIINLLF